jgi:putative transposase
VWQGATENTAVVKGLLEDLVDRGLEVQRCQIHKRRNGKEYLPENCQKDYDRRMRNPYAINNYVEAKETLQKISRQLERINPSAANMGRLLGEDGGPYSYYSCSNIDCR